MTSDNLKSDWASFSGMKPKAKKHTGPNRFDFEVEVYLTTYQLLGSKTILQDRIAAFERGEIKTITQTRELRRPKVNSSLLVYCVMTPKRKKVRKKR